MKQQISDYKAFSFKKLKILLNNKFKLPINVV